MFNENNIIKYNVTLGFIKKNIYQAFAQTRFLLQHESCGCKCGLNESVCNSNQKWYHNECRCEWGECNSKRKWNHNECRCDVH